MKLKIYKYLLEKTFTYFMNSTYRNSLQELIWRQTTIEEVVRHIHKI